jgi:hypothetical protein
MNRRLAPPFGPVAIVTIAAGALGFALGLCVALAAGVQPDAALARALVACGVLAATCGVAAALVVRPAAEADDGNPGGAA